MDAVKYYCKKYNIELIVANEKREYDFEPWGNGCFEPWWDERLVEMDYDKLILIDSDTMIRWDAPNIFEVGKDKEICVVADAGGANTGGYHLSQWKDLNPNIKTTTFGNISYVHITVFAFTFILTIIATFAHL